jgi:hypothetical protein
MDIEAKHIPADKDGVRIAELDELSYRELLWTHQPITDFWRVGKGYAKKLEKYNLHTMGDVARCSLGEQGAYQPSENRLAAIKHKIVHGNMSERRMNKKMSKELKDYEDILYLPHYVSSRRRKMLIKDRAAQFSPFAAVVGHGNAVKEAARYTDQRKELDETEKAIIDDQLREIEAHLPNKSEVAIVYFSPDALKAGGEYITKVGSIKKFDVYEREVLMVDGTSIAIEEIYNIVK